MRVLMSRIAGSLVAALLLAGMALAQAGVPLEGLKADPNAPVEIEADALTVSRADGTATFQGHVLIVQGAMRLSAATVKVDYAAGTDGGQGKITRLTASGGVTLATETDAAESETAVYDVARGIITMTGKVLLTQGRNVISGETLVVDLASGNGTMQGRVRTVLQPEGK